MYGGGACPGPVVYGVSPGPPGFGPGMPTMSPPGLVGWAQLARWALKERERQPSRRRSEDVSCC